MLQLLGNGVSVAAANYRLTDTAPYPAQMHDAARALQFIRLHAAEYGIDPTRIGATGGSAGAGISQWLAFHDDLADPDNPDPLLRQSTRLTAIVPVSAQTSYDPRFIKRLMNTEQVEEALIAFFGMRSAADVDDARFHPLFEDSSPLNHLTTDDPPVLFFFRQSNDPLPPNSSGELHIHHPKFGFALKEKADELGVECTVLLSEDHPEGQPIDKYVKFFLEKFGVRAFPEVAQSESGQGRILFVSIREEKQEIYVMDPDGSDVQRLTTTKADAGSWQPAWSPDGRMIAFASNPDGNSDIFVMDADGSNIRRLTHTPDGEQFPSWSPDGEQIVFALNPSTGDAGIYVMNADGSNVRRLAQYEYVNVTRPVWSPDGEKIAFSSGVQLPDGEWESDIFVIDADGSNVQRLTRHARTDYQASWSPDGRRIVFDSTRDGDYEIYVMDADGSNVGRLTQHEAVDARPIWSSDGTKIAFHSSRREADDPGPLEIFVMDADGSNVSRLTYSETFAIHPDW